MEAPPELACAAVAGRKADLVLRLSRSPLFSHSSSATSCSAISFKIRLSRSSSPDPFDAPDDFPAPPVLCLATLFVRLFDVFVLARIDLDQVAFLDMEGHLHHGAGLELGRLGA